MHTLKNFETITPWKYFGRHDHLPAASEGAIVFPSVAGHEVETWGNIVEITYEKDRGQCLPVTDCMTLKGMVRFHTYLFLCFFFF
jgi:hypothetical protein